MIGYVVVEKEYQYNDEYYYADGDGGTPVKIFTDKAKAEAEAKERTLKTLSSIELHGYGYDADEVLDVREAADILGITEDEVLESFRDEELQSLFSGREEELAKILTIDFFYVRELEIEN